MDHLQEAPGHSWLLIVIRLDGCVNEKGHVGDRRLQLMKNSPRLFKFKQPGKIREIWQIRPTVPVGENSL
jgi:hypothetical protein